MSRLILLSALFLCCISANAQDRKKFIINPGEKLLEKIPSEDMYRYREFQLADIWFKDGRKLSSWINYNKLFGEMQFIDISRDTLSVTDETLVLFMAVEKDTFYFFEGWIEQVGGNNMVKLGQRKKIDLLNREKIGGMEQPAFGAIETNTKYSGNQNIKDIVAKEKLTYAEYTNWYFGDRFNHFFPATKKSLLKIYDRNEKLISKYIDDNKISFFKEEDIIKLMKFLETL